MRQLAVFTAAQGTPLGGWLVIEAARIRHILDLEHAVLLRGFDVLDPEALGSAARLISSEEALDYRYGITPREKLNSGVYTSTELDQKLNLAPHGELSFASKWPLTIFFSCVRPSTTGGQSPIADMRSVLTSLDPEARHAFEEHGVLYVRNYGAETRSEDVSWMQAFETTDPTEVESFCTASDIQMEWLPGMRLRTMKTTPSVRVHPRTGERVWFNQAHLFHSSTIERRIRRGLLARYGSRGLPRNSFFGEGSQIPSWMIEEVQRAIDVHTVMFDWRAGDLLVLDNMIYAHGRRPFEGERRVLVSMAEPYDGKLDQPLMSAGG